MRALLEQIEEQVRHAAILEKIEEQMRHAANPSIRAVIGTIPSLDEIKAAWRIQDEAEAVRRLIGAAFWPVSVE